MIEKYGLFDSLEGDIREYAEADLALLVKALSKDGVRGGEDALKVSPALTGLGVSVSAGFALVQGRYYALVDDGSGEMTIRLTAANAYPRIDRIVLTLDYALRTVKLGVLMGTEAATPKAPALTRSTSAYMLSLASVYVGVGAASLSASAITDERADESLCGMDSSHDAQAMAAAQEALAAAQAAQSTAQAALNRAVVSSVGGKTGDVALSAGEGISVSGVTIANTGVRAVAQGSAEGTIRVNTGGAEADIPVGGWAQAFAAKLNASKIQGGVISVDVRQYEDDSTDLMRNIYKVAVTFPAAMDSVPACVLTSPITTDPLRRRASPNNATGSGFDCHVYNGTSAGTVWVYWLAFWV